MLLAGSQKALGGGGDCGWCRPKKKKGRTGTREEIHVERKVEVSTANVEKLPGITWYSQLKILYL